MYQNSPIARGIQIDGARAYQHGLKLSDNPILHRPHRGIWEAGWLQKEREAYEAQGGERRTIGRRWDQGNDTKQIAESLGYSEQLIERELHCVLEARRQTV